MNVSTTPAPTRPGAPAVRSRGRRGTWLRTMVQWHWVSSAVCLSGMFLFTVTGITLNHAGEIESKPAITKGSCTLSEEHLAAVNAVTGSAAPLPPAVAASLGKEFSRTIRPANVEWSDSEVYVSMPSPGADAWLTIDRTSGDVEFESTDRGWIAYFNDLHKARHTGLLWKWFLDLFAIGTLIFCLTGLYLLYFHARHRRMTWPIVALGLAIPWFLALLISHAG
ncbi:MAG TPA: PepSY-associated TM helix domain-containing protein [Caulifigura sp.]|nr:PepSY-associated TM helix domain-containing protein [Caulifigura sp.]